MSQVPTTQLAKMSIDPKFVELTADVLGMFFKNVSRLDPHAHGGFFLPACSSSIHVSSVLLINLLLI